MSRHTRTRARRRWVAQLNLAAGRVRAKQKGPPEALRVRYKVLARESHFVLKPHGQAGAQDGSSCVEAAHCQQEGEHPHQVLGQPHLLAARCFLLNETPSPKGDEISTITTAMMRGVTGMEGIILVMTMKLIWGGRCVLLLMRRVTTEVAMVTRLCMHVVRYHCVTICIT